jgi:cyclopropane fatty-acyl-phospholipid synthase-like methyltransferase
MPACGFTDQLIEYLSPESGEQILEFGGGTGANLLIAAMRFPGTPDWISILKFIKLKIRS